MAGDTKRIESKFEELISLSEEHSGRFYDLELINHADLYRIMYHTSFLKLEGSLRSPLLFDLEKIRRKKRR